MLRRMIKTTFMKPQITAAISINRVPNMPAKNDQNSFNSDHPRVTF